MPDEDGSNEWDEVADEWDSAASVRAYAAAAWDSLVSVATAIGFDLDGSRACDFGCGTGVLTERLAERCATVDAIDSSPAMLARLEDKIATNGWTDVRARSELTDDAGPYDLVVCSSVLGFVDDHPATVAEFARRLRPGGLFVQWDWEAEDDAADHGLTRAAMTAALVDAGLVGGTVEPDFVVEADGERMQPLRGWGVRRARRAND